MSPEVGNPYDKIAVLMYPSAIDMGNITSLESAPKIKVVIVENHAAVRRALRKRLSATPSLDVVAAIQGPAEALSYLCAGDSSGNHVPTADVVLMGLQNESDEELFDTLKIIRNMVRVPAAVIVLAPFADEVERSLMLQAGVSNYLLKYIDSHRLIMEIESAYLHNSARITRGS